MFTRDTKVLGFAETNSTYYIVLQNFDGKCRAYRLDPVTDWSSSSDNTWSSLDTISSAMSTNLQKISTSS